MASILLTLAEDRAKTTRKHFAVRYAVDEEDCFHFAESLRYLGHHVYFANWNDLDGDTFRRVFLSNDCTFVDPLHVGVFDLVFVYKMEGFYFDIPKFLAMVRTFQKYCRHVINHPDTIAHNMDKRYLFDLMERNIPVIPTSLVNETVKKRLSDGEPFVMKPMRGERGNGIILARRIEDLSSIASKLDEYLAQKFMPEIRQGERSLVYLGHKFQHAVLKMPSPKNEEEFRCNESLGGTVSVYTPKADELEVADRILFAYESMGLPVHFSRIDLIRTESGPVLVEAELLNPSIYANYSKRGPEYGKALALYFDDLLTNPRSIGPGTQAIAAGHQLFSPTPGMR